MLKDSTVTVFRDSVLFIPVERVVDVVLPYDTLKMETSLASSTAYVDTATHTLKGTLENKKGAEFKYKERNVYKEHRDTIYIKEPFEVIKEKNVTPRWAYWTLTFTLLVLVLIGLKIYIKFRNISI